MKGDYIEELIKRLSDLGVPAKNGDVSDIKVEATFGEEKWGTGENQITYYCLISFDEQNETVYMFERTKESKSGLSFGGDSETSFQSGKTLYRKVKSTHYGPDGVAHEVNLDLGAIPKSVKDYANQIGWKFKTVLSEKKAHSVVGSSGFKRSDELSKPVQTPQGDNLHHLSEGKNRPRKKSMVTFLWIAFLLLIVGFMWLSETSVMGIGVSVLITFVGYYLQQKKGCLISIITWIIVFVLIFGVYIFTTDFESENNLENDMSDNSKKSSNNENIEAVYSEEIYNLGSDASYFITANDRTDYQANKIIHDIKLQVLIYQDILINSMEEDARIVEARITDFEWIEAPKKGKFSNLMPMSGLNAEFSPRVEGNEVIYDTDAFSQQYSGWSNSLCFQFELAELGTYQYPDNFSGTSSFEISAKNMDLSADDVRCSFKYKVVLTSSTGKQYYSETIVDAIQGDYLYGGVSPTISSRVFDYTQGKQFSDMN